MYIHDITLIAQADILITIKTILNRDLNNLHNYLKRWYLTLDLNKTVTQPHSGPPQGGGGGQRVLWSLGPGNLEAWEKNIIEVLITHIRLEK